jgi:hypothetical protein
VKNSPSRRKETSYTSRQPKQRLALSCSETEQALAPTELPFATQRGHELFHSLFKVLFSFRSHYLFAIGLETIFSLRRSTPASLHSTLKLCDFWNNGGMRQRSGEHERDDSPLWWNFSERLFHRASTTPKVRALQFHCVPIPSNTDSEIGLYFTQVTRRYHRYDGCCLFLPLMICLSSGGHPALQRWFFENELQI